jgi:hypothetical protein
VAIGPSGALRGTGAGGRQEDGKEREREGEVAVMIEPNHRGAKNYMFECRSRAKVISADELKK